MKQIFMMYFNHLNTTPKRIDNLSASIEKRKTKT